MGVNRFIELEQGFGVFSDRLVANTSARLVAGPFGRVVETPDRPPSEGIEPMRQHQKANKERFPEIAALEVRQLVLQDTHAAGRAEPAPQLGGNEQPVSPSQIAQVRAIVSCHLQGNSSAYPLPDE